MPLALSLLCLPLAAPAYEFTPELRVNSDAPGRYAHVLGFPNGRSIARLESGPGLVWDGNQENGSDFHVYFSRSSDGGRTFVDPVRVDNQPGGYTARDPTLAGDGDSVVCVLWGDGSLGTDHLFCSVSTDAGCTFGVPVRVDSQGGHVPQLPSAALVGDSLLLVAWAAWQEPQMIHGNIYVTHSTNRGASFAPATLIPSTLNLHATAPSLFADTTGGIHLAWRDDRSDTVRRYYHVYFSTSTDSGRTFTPPVIVDSAGPFSGSFPSLTGTPDAALLVCAYKARPSGTHHVYSTISTDRGATFASRVRLDSAGTSDTPSAAYHSPGSLAAVWHDSRNGGYGDVYFASSEDSGQTYSPGRRVHTALSPGVLNPHVAAGPADTVWVAWSDRRHGDTTPDIYFARGCRAPQRLTEVQSYRKMRVAVGPSPSRGNVQVRWTGVSAQHRVTLTLHDVSGRLVMSRVMDLMSSVELSLRDLPTGVYALRWATAGSRGQSPVVIIK